MAQPCPLKVGLVIGKFAQVHNGHLDLIKYALTIVDKLFIVVYHSPDHTSTPLPERAAWLRLFFPDENIVVIEGWNAPNRHEDTPEVRHLQEQYLENVMEGINLTHIISSEEYGEHLSKHLRVENVVYDKTRHNRPISSTMIRNNFNRHLNQVPQEIRNRIKEDVHVIV